ncbi:transcription termination factor 2 [Orussus abietinus]|uniref:transcription termination factor 2 n=1 Tax=Orussus abietinus TaxID=222816 RepID=UPI0006259486|nr:transcription termination factor 2 [Orussus abietinus]
MDRTWRNKRGSLKSLDANITLISDSDDEDTTSHHHLAPIIDSDEEETITQHLLSRKRIERPTDSDEDSINISISSSEPRVSRSFSLDDTDMKIDNNMLSPKPGRQRRRNVIYDSTDDDSENETTYKSIESHSKALLTKETNVLSDTSSEIDENENSVSSKNGKSPVTSFLEESEDMASQAGLQTPPIDSYESDSDFITKMRTTRKSYTTPTSPYKSNDDHVMIDSTLGATSSSASDFSEEEHSNGKEDNATAEPQTPPTDSCESEHDRLPPPIDSESYESSVAVSLALKEVGVKNIDAIAAQRSALLLCNTQQVRKELKDLKDTLNSALIEMLPDKGAKLKQSIANKEKELKLLKRQLEETHLTPSQKKNTRMYAQNPGPSSLKFDVMIPKSEKFSDTKEHSFDASSFKLSPIEKSDIKYEIEESMDLRSRENSRERLNSPLGKPLGRKAQETHDRELALTVERIKDLHDSLVARPTEDQKANDPNGLTVPLMAHQQHALAWLLWRESQIPAGGVLADDMGLGKTLTMISLIMTTQDQDNSNNKENYFFSAQKRPHINGGTLVVCPASLLSQWENEILNRCKPGILSVQIFHGTNRKNEPLKLAKFDVVITTYNLLSREFKKSSPLYKINWKRVILDEAHVVRNPKSQVSEAVCGLMADKRWALTGTPIQNKELDLYAILKFLKCSPFDDLRVWKRWVDNKSISGHDRLATLMKTLMLRRTKQELQDKGDLKSLPVKYIEEIEIKLDPDEQLVYEKILIYSRTLFAQFLAQRAEKNHMRQMYDNYLSSGYRGDKNAHFTKAQKQLLAYHADVKTHEILVLLLRLRQVCCHPPLVHAMLDQTDVEQNSFTDEGPDTDLLNKINQIKLDESFKDIDDLDDLDMGVNERVKEDLLNSQNPVFRDERQSAKMRALLEKIQEILLTDDKIIVISQWTSLLKVIAFHLNSIKGATYNTFSGDVPVKNRQAIVNSFNDPDSDPRILLLSLTAGGVGLNLVGGNHLLFFDIHWNPQLETQAQDRIYRFGQTKDVRIYKYITKNTIEERIKLLQERKLQLAEGVLGGVRSTGGAKLTLEDLKSLFQM